MDLFSDCNKNTFLLFLLAALLLCGSDKNIFSGCSLPILLAIGYCLYKNGTLSDILKPNNCCCNC